MNIFTARMKVADPKTKKKVDAEVTLLLTGAGLQVLLAGSKPIGGPFPMAYESMAKVRESPQKNNVDSVLLLMDLVSRRRPQYHGGGAHRAPHF